MKKMLKILVTLFLVVAVVCVAGCASKITTAENSTQGALEQIIPAVTPHTYYADSSSRSASNWLIY